MAMIEQGRGVLRVNGAVTQNWVYKDGLAPVAETDGGTNIVGFFVYGTSPFSPDYMVRDGVIYRLIRDFVGSVRLVVNAATGDIAQRLDYDSFGNIIADTNPGFQPFGFKSGLYDPDTGLVHFGARWYDPETGRWIAKDPILLAGGLNLYAFCGNYPVNFSDPWGLCENFSQTRLRTLEEMMESFSRLEGMDLRTPEQQREHQRLLDDWARNQELAQILQEKQEQLFQELGRNWPTPDQMEQLDEMCAAIVGGSLVAVPVAESGIAVWSGTSNFAKWAALNTTIRLATGTGGKLPEVIVLPPPPPPGIGRLWPF